MLLFVFFLNPLEVGGMEGRSSDTGYGDGDGDSDEGEGDSDNSKPLVSSLQVPRHWVKHFFLESSQNLSEVGSSVFLSLQCATHHLEPHVTWIWCSNADSESL